MNNQAGRMRGILNKADNIVREAEQSLEDEDEMGSRNVQKVTFKQSQSSIKTSPRDSTIMTEIAAQGLSRDQKKIHLGKSHRAI